MIDHLSIGVTDLVKSKAFYQQVLAPLGYSVKIEMEHGVCFSSSAGDLWIVKSQPAKTHFAFRADDHAAVDAFYQAAIAAGGTDNGAPGLRPHYHENYYAAFVIDPDGYNVEAVCHQKNH
ncbi:glyoxalase [Enterococcus florum]|uniref:Glyoxalase n=1 Tax=Enterococcus florum TaxID=2480627 RepID=A0A4P5PF73_9ENTE|nr:VOC family protein [Enterococcus florum]GCF95031.1 glyoxalase [Enterococcus florum]